MLLDAHNMMLGLVSHRRLTSHDSVSNELAPVVKILCYIKRGAERPFKCLHPTLKKNVGALLAPMEPLFTALVGLNQSTQHCNIEIMLSILSSKLQRCYRGTLSSECVFLLQLLSFALYLSCHPT